MGVVRTRLHGRGSGTSCGTWTIARHSRDRGFAGARPAGMRERSGRERGGYPCDGRDRLAESALDPRLDERRVRQPGQRADRTVDTAGDGAAVDAVEQVAGEETRLPGVLYDRPH